jgi:hypothetical protein
MSKSIILFYNQLSILSPLDVEANIYNIPSTNRGQDIHISTSYLFIGAYVWVKFFESKLRVGD